MHGPGAGTLLNAKIICEWTQMSLLQHLALAELFAAAAISCSGSLGVVVTHTDIVCYQIPLWGKCWFLSRPNLLTVGRLGC